MTPADLPIALGVCRLAARLPAPEQVPAAARVLGQLEGVDPMECTAKTPGDPGYRYGCRCPVCRAGHAAKQREYRAGHAAMITARTYPPAIDRLLDRCEEVDGCWVYTGPTTRKGYVRLRIVRGPKRSGHRIAYEYFIGPVPEGLQLDHLCRNRACCNPWHLEPVTSRENTLRGRGPGVVRLRFGERTMCIRGHEYTPESTYIRTDRCGRTSRACRKCQVIRGIPYQKARRERMRRERNV